MQTTSIRAGGITWNVAGAGPDTGAPVLLLHGFPEFWRSWTRQLQSLPEAGFRAYAPDLPGIGGTDEPVSYRLDELARLVAGLARALSDDRVHVVGHDWGAIIACATAHLHADALGSVVVASGVHPAAFAAALRSPHQLLKSWYVGAFQLPGAATLLGLGGSALATRLFPGGTFVKTPDDIKHGVAYYRANMNPLRLGSHGIGRIGVPAMIVHAARDRYITRGLVDRTAEEFDDLRTVEPIGCDHFVHRHCAEQFDAALVRFLRSVA